MNFKLPKNINYNNIVKNILYVITLILAVIYIINEETLALISLMLIACGIYIINKNIIFALFISIIITNLLLVIGYFKSINIIENIDNIDNCCPGSAFYNSNLLKYTDVIDNINNKNTCAIIEKDISRYMPTSESQKARFFSMLYSNNAYMKATSICNTMDESSAIFNKKGTLFKKSEKVLNILEDPNILPKDILDMLASSNIRNSLDESKKRILETNVIEELQTMNDEIFAIPRENNLQSQITISDLTASQITKLTNIKNILINLYALSNISLIKKKNINYTLVSNKDNITNTYRPIVTSNGTQYILNVDQFLDCSGFVQTSNTGTLSQSNIIDLSNNDYFGTSGRPISEGGLGDASYNTYGNITLPELYPSNRDLEMELRRLETIPSSGNVPVNIISSYLNTINNFYEKQIQNITSFRSNTFSQETINDIYSIKTITPTFFTYDNTRNNQYQCEDSVTGNSEFKYCGPSAYYEVPKF